MKNTSLYFMIIIISSLWLNASILSSVTIREASSTLQKSTQELASSYLLSILYPHKKSLKRTIYAQLKVVSSSMKEIAENTDSKKTQAMLSYFAIKKAEIINLLKQAPSLETTDDIVTLSEVFTEGSLSILHHNNDLFSKKNPLLLELKQMKILLTNITKYYTAIKINPKNLEYQRKMKKSIQIFDDKLFETEAQVSEFIASERIVIIENLISDLSDLGEYKCVNQNDSNLNEYLKVKDILGVFLSKSSTYNISLDEIKDYLDDTLF